MSDAPDRIYVVCECGRRLSVRASSAGKRAKCPRCQRMFVIPGVDAGPPQEELAPDDSESLLQDLAAPAAHAASASTPAEAAGVCPNCGVPMAAEARVCVSCGYDRRTGRALRAASEVVGPSKVGDTARSAGSFTLGIVLSAVGAAVGAIIWAGVAILLNLELGYVAWAVGLLAGGGMLLGARRQTVPAGVAAAGIALAGVLLGKALIFGFYVRPYIAAEAKDKEADWQRGYVVLRLAEDIVMERGAATDRERMACWPDAMAEAEQHAKRMSAEEVRQSWRYYQDHPEPTPPTKDVRPARLGYHHADMRAYYAGLAPDDPQRKTLQEEELAKYGAMSDEELSAAVAELEAWMGGTKWEDPEYVHHKAIYGRMMAVMQAQAEEAEDDAFTFSPDQWTELYAKTSAEVSALSPQEKLAEAREFDAQQEEHTAAMIAGIESLKEMLAALPELELDYAALTQPFFESMFSLFDVIFIILAVATAYGLASGRRGGGE
jgi:hypothetical protein